MGGRVRPLGQIQQAGALKWLKRCQEGEWTFCGVQEHRLARSLAANQTRLIKGKDSTFKFSWCGKERGQGGAGFLFGEKWVDKGFGVLRISDRIILIRLVIGKVVFTFLSVYAPQAGLQEAEED